MIIHPASKRVTSKNLKIGVFSDVHANLPALLAVLDFLLHEQGVDFLVCAGDVVGYGPYPNECCNALMLNNVETIMGNHEKITRDQDLLLFDGEDPLPSSTTRLDIPRVTFWTYQQLNPENQDYLFNLPGSRVFSQLGFETHHSYPENHYIVATGLARDLFDHMQTRLAFIGLTHEPVLWYFEDGLLLRKIMISGKRVDISKYAKAALNVGSVGQPRDSDPRAACAVYEHPGYVTLHRVAYDIEQTQTEMKRLQFPEYFIDRLSRGI